MKQIIYRSQMEAHEDGYRDSVYVAENDRQPLYHGICRVAPNPGHEENGVWKPWNALYGWVAPTEMGKPYSGQCVFHQKYGKCILWNNGKKIISRTPNPRHEGAYYLEQIFSHAGQSAFWPGSAGCPTHPPRMFLEFMECFEIGEKVEIAVVDCLEMRKAHLNGLDR